MSISFQNSLTTRNITSPLTFDGEYVDITAYAEINILLQGTLPLEGDYYVVTAYLSNDRVNVLETIETNVTYPISNKLIKITPTANFIKIKLETFALDVITNFNMSTVLRSVPPLSDTTTVKGGVAIIQSVALDVATLPDITIDNTEFKAIGEEPQARFFATPATNTSTVYADGAPGVNVNGGWLYENTATNKINWYVYANTISQASTAKKLEDIKDMYMVIYQKPTAISDIKNPYISFYSLPEAANNTSWYKNRYVYSNYDDASEVGTKLLYIGMDNPLIHPEITKRIKLDYDPISSTNTLEAGANETLWLSSVHTSSNTAAGKYNFVFSEFGLNFNVAALNSTVLPIIDNKVQVSVSNFPATQAVTGSFYPDTQAVTIATPVAVTGSFYPDTQAVTIAAAIDTNIKTIDTAVTFQCQERPTTESYFTTAVGTGGVAITLAPKTLRNFSINTTSSTIIYVYLYDTGAFPVPADVPKFVFPIKDANNIVFNSFDHRFEHGIGIRATTTYNGIISPTANSVFVNMTLSD